MNTDKERMGGRPGALSAPVESSVGGVLRCCGRERTLREEN